NVYFYVFFFSSRRRHTRCYRDWSSDVCSSDLRAKVEGGVCVSCHTGVTYLLARPVLRHALNEGQPTTYEKGLLGGLHAQAEAERSEERRVGKECRWRGWGARG